MYGSTPESLRPTHTHLSDIDLLLIDLPDIGCRYYTFAATMFHCLEAAAEAEMTVVILDRPNPLGRIVEGPIVHDGFNSFVGAHPICTRHGLTLTELAKLYVRERCLNVRVECVLCHGFKPSMRFEKTELPWVMPSPNMPTPDTAFVYPGQCLLEGTNLSEGRGTTRPFEICGAPWIDSEKLVKRLESHGCPGVVFRPLSFRPTFQKHAGQLCGGVQLHVTDREVFRPVRTGLLLLYAMRLESGGHFRWRTEPYEFVDDKPAIDLLFRSDRERKALETAREPEEISLHWAVEEKAFIQRCRPILSY